MRKCSFKKFSSAFFQVLDRLILYLRIVHSIDYYNTCEYPSEDEMPNRCGMIHVRGPIPPNRITQGEGQPFTLVLLGKVNITGENCSPALGFGLFKRRWGHNYFILIIFSYSATMAENDGGEAESFV